MTTHAGPHVHVEGECPWIFDGDGTHLWCDNPVVVGSDECDGTDHPHHGPRRIQLRRTKGWRKPSGAVVVSRPSKWGNPFALHGHSVVGQRWALVRMNWRRGVNCWADVAYSTHTSKAAALDHSVDLFRTLMNVSARDYPDRFEEWIAPLRGHDLACWCKPTDPCHADVLLEIANAPLDVSPPVARVEDAGSRPRIVTEPNETPQSYTRTRASEENAARSRMGAPTGEVGKP